MSKRRLKYLSKDELVLSFRDNHSIRVTGKEDGKRFTKIITVENLMKCFKESLKGVKISTGILPSNVISYKIDTDAGEQYIVVEFEDTKADVTYMNTVYENFPLPRLLFGFVINDEGRICSVKLGVPELGKLTPDTRMYKYPFSNVLDFSLCIGNNPMPHIKSLQSVKNLPNYIISLPDNDDRYHSENNKLNMERRDLMEHLVDKDRQYYYDNVLIPMPGKTLSNFI